MRVRLLKGTACDLAIIVGVVVAFVSFMIVIHLISGILGIDGVGMWFYGSPSGMNWGLNFFNLGGLELRGPNSISFFSCSGQC